jgi:hypothetical protein
MRETEDVLREELIRALQSERENATAAIANLLAYRGFPAEDAGDETAS